MSLIMWKRIWEWAISPQKEERKDCIIQDRVDTQFRPGWLSQTLKTIFQYWSIQA